MMNQQRRQHFRPHTPHFTPVGRRPQKRASSPPSFSQQQQQQRKRKKSSPRISVNGIPQKYQHWRPVAGNPAAAAAASNISGIPLGMNGCSSPAFFNTALSRRKRQREGALSSNKRSRTDGSSAPNSNFFMQQSRRSFDSISPFDNPPANPQPVQHQQRPKRKLTTLALRQSTKRIRGMVDIDGRPSTAFGNSCCTDIVPAFPCSPEPSGRTNWNFTRPLTQSGALSQNSMLTDRTSAASHAQLVPARPFGPWVTYEPKEPEEVLIEIIDDDGDCGGASMDVEDDGHDDNLSIFSVD